VFEYWVRDRAMLKDQSSGKKVVIFVDIRRVYEKWSIFCLATLHLAQNQLVQTTTRPKYNSSKLQLEVSKVDVNIMLTYVNILRPLATTWPKYNSAKILLSSSRVDWYKRKVFWPSCSLGELYFGQVVAWTSCILAEL
jgi:hypothetical protein